MTRTGKENSQKNDEIANDEVADELELNKPQADGTEDGVDVSAVSSGGAQTTRESVAEADAQSTPAEDSTELAAEGSAESTDQITVLLDQVAEYQDSYLRAKAEVDNIRKRAETEVANARKFALEGFVRELLTVKDSLEMALAVDQQSDSGVGNRGVSEGLELILKQLESVFANFSVETVEPEVGDKLDPDQHQAMSVEESHDIPPNCVSKVIQKGYSLNNRLLRPAMVLVAKLPGEAAEKG
jgi:molecular chaperone GrpE